MKSTSKRTLALLFCLAAVMAFWAVAGESKEEEVALFPVVVDGKWGDINRKGKVVIEPRFERAWDFSEGLAAVAMYKQMGYVDTKGEMVIKPQFNRVKSFSEGLAVVVIDQRWGYIDTTGKMVVSREYPGPTGVYQTNPEGKRSLLSHGVFDSSWWEKLGGNFSEGMAWVQATNEYDNMAMHEYGYIDKSGKVVVSPQFTAAGDFKEGIARVSNYKDGKHDIRYIDTKGNELPIRAHGEFSEGLARFEDRGLVGYVDREGAVVIEPRFSWGSDFKEGLAAVGIKGNVGYIDKKGEIIIEPVFNGAREFSYGMAMIRLRDSWGYINKSGKVVIEPQFDHRNISNFRNGLAKVKVDDKFGYIDKTGKFVWPPTK